MCIRKLIAVVFRYQDQLEQQRAANEENLRRQEESVAKQEKIRQQTIKQELQMREQERKNRIKEEAEIKAKVWYLLLHETRLFGAKYFAYFISGWTRK